MGKRGAVPVIGDNLVLLILSIVILIFILVVLGTRFAGIFK
jgi:hypothetical protein